MPVKHQWDNSEVGKQENRNDEHHREHLCGVPVDGYGRHGVDAGEHRRDGEEVVEAAVHLPKVPLSVSRVDEVD